MIHSNANTLQIYHSLNAQANWTLQDGAFSLRALWLLVMRLLSRKDDPFVKSIIAWFNR